MRPGDGVDRRGDFARARRARQRAGQRARALRAIAAWLAELIHQVDDIARLLAERDRAVRFEQRVAAECARAQPVLGLEPGERQPLLLELGAAVGERLCRRGLRLAWSCAGAGEIGANIGGARADRPAEWSTSTARTWTRSSTDPGCTMRSAPGAGRATAARRSAAMTGPWLDGEPGALRGEQPVDRSRSAPGLRRCRPRPAGYARRRAASCARAPGSRLIASRCAAARSSLRGRARRRPGMRRLASTKALLSARETGVCADAAKQAARSQRDAVRDPYPGEPSLIALSFAMIGVVGKDARRAPQLFGEHRAGEQMRPGRAAERREAGRRSRARHRRSRRPRRSGSGSRARLRRASAQPVGEGARAEHLAVFVEQHDPGLAVDARGILPPLSGSSVSRIGQVSRFT